MHRVSAGVIAILGLLAAELNADNWPHWRGPSASGVSSEAKLPVRWSDSENIAWKAPVDGLGISSPIVWGDLVVRDVAGRQRHGATRPAAGAGRQPAGVR